MTVCYTIRMNIKRRVLRGVNDLATTHPYLIDEWDDSEDIGEFSHGSEYKAWFVCPRRGHRYQTMIMARARVGAGKGWRECANLDQTGKRKRTKNRLEKARPDIYAQMVEKEDISVSSGEIVEWQCDKGHQWKARVSDRTRAAGSTGCPQCSIGKRVSSAEMDIVRLLTAILGYDVVANSRKIIPPLELDIYIPALNKAIEYNGRYWHSLEGASDRDKRKAERCSELGIELLTVWDDEEDIMDRIVRFIES